MNNIANFENFIDFFIKINEIIGNLNKISNELEYKPVVLDFKFNYKFYKQFFIDSFNSNFKSFPLLILQYNKKNYMMSSELFESYIEMTYNSFIIIENFSNGKYNFLNFGVEKSVFSLNLYLESIFIHYPNLVPKLYKYGDLMYINDILKEGQNFTLIILRKNSSSYDDEIQVLEDATVDFKTKYKVIKEIANTHTLRYIVFFNDFFFESKNKLFINCPYENESINSNDEILPQNIPDVLLDEITSSNKLLSTMDVKTTLDFIKTNQIIDNEIKKNEEKLEQQVYDNTQLIDRILNSLDF